MVAMTTGYGYRDRY